MEAIGERIACLRAAVADELRACGRPLDAVTIVGVSKKQPAGVVAEAISAGLTDIGENYVQEATAKFALLPPVRTHYIGHIQTNKAKVLAQHFAVVQSVDRLDAGIALSRAAERLGRVVPVLLQLNISPIERFGCPPNEADALADALRAQAGLRFDGIMAIGPATDDRNVISRAFNEAAMTFARIGGTTLSIGMSGDWREAVRAGSTMIRIGTAIFGERRYDTREEDSR